MVRLAGCGESDASVAAASVQSLAGVAGRSRIERLLFVALGGGNGSRARGCGTGLCSLCWGGRGSPEPRDRREHREACGKRACRPVHLQGSPGAKASTRAPNGSPKAINPEVRAGEANFNAFPPREAPERHSASALLNLEPKGSNEDANSTHWHVFKQEPTRRLHKSAFCKVTPLPASACNLTRTT
eukprot:366083-Chlamydomonas_euryale.AAC.20